MAADTHGRGCPLGVVVSLVRVLAELTWPPPAAPKGLASLPVCSEPQYLAGPLGGQLQRPPRRPASRQRRGPWRRLALLPPCQTLRLGGGEHCGFAAAVVWQEDLWLVQWPLVGSDGPGREAGLSQRAGLSRRWTVVASQRAIAMGTSSCLALNALKAGYLSGFDADSSATRVAKVRSRPWLITIQKTCCSVLIVHPRKIYRASSERKRRKRRYQL